MLKSRETRSRRACLYYSDSYPLVTSFCHSFHSLFEVYPAKKSGLEGEEINLG